MIRLLYVLICITVLTSCGVFRKKAKYKQNDSYQELSDVHSHQTPKQIAKDYGTRNKKQLRVSKREHKKEWKAIKKRNKKKLKGTYFDK